MTSAEVLALGGTISSAIVMLGGMLKRPKWIGLAGAVMLAANLVVLMGLVR